MEAFCEAGGAEYLGKISKSHPQVFCTLLGKILPPQTQISGDPSSPIQTIKRVELVVIQPPKDITPVKSAPKGLLAEVVNVNASR